MRDPKDIRLLASIQFSVPCSMLSFDASVHARLTAAAARVCQAHRKSGLSRPLLDVEVGGNLDRNQDSSSASKASLPRLSSEGAGKAASLTPTCAAWSVRGTIGCDSAGLRCDIAAALDSIDAP